MAEPAAVVVVVAVGAATADLLGGGGTPPLPTLLLLVAPLLGGGMEEEVLFVVVMVKVIGGLSPLPIPWPATRCMVVVMVIVSGGGGSCCVGLHARCYFYAEWSPAKTEVIVTKSAFKTCTAARTIILSTPTPTKQQLLLLIVGPSDAAYLFLGYAFVCCLL